MKNTANYEPLIIPKILEHEQGGMLGIDHEGALEMFQENAAEFFGANMMNNDARELQGEVAQAGGGNRLLEMAAAQARLAPPRAIDRDRAGLDNQAGLNFEDKNEPEIAEKLDLHSILLGNMTAEELLTLKPINGSVSKTELDFVQRQAEREGKTLTYSKSGKEIVDENGKTITQEIEGKIDGRTEITTKDGQILAAGYFDFDSSVPMTTLPQAQAPDAAVKSK